MIHTIENDQIQLQIATLGGEMMSLKTKEDQCEYLWQGNPDYWKGRAINLFPICGRLYQGQYTYRGQNYQMNSHGFLRASEMTVVSQQSDIITFSLTDTQETRKNYPFSFCYQLEYRLVGNRVDVSFQVDNTDDKPLIFTVGGHPGFCLPIEQELAFEDYRVEFDPQAAPRMLEFTPECFLTGDTSPFSLDEDHSLSLDHRLFDQDAIFLQDMGDAVTLRSEKGKKGVTVTCLDMKYLGLWHTPKSDAPFLCLEPWWGIPSYQGKVDDLQTKRDMIHLQPGTQYITGYSITIW